MLCALMFDEMSIRNNLQWNVAQWKYSGLVDIGRKYVGEDTIPLANDALVYIRLAVLKKILSYFFAEIYFCTNGFDASEKAAILNETLRRLAEYNVEVVSVTFDGHKSNMTMAKVIGANFAEGKGWISVPVDLSRQIYVL